MRGKKVWLHDLTEADAKEALRIAEHMRRQIGMLSAMIDATPGRNVRFELQTDISRVASAIGDGESAGRVLFALAWELEPDFIDPYTRTPEVEARRRRDQWFERLAGLGITHPAPSTQEETT